MAEKKPETKEILLISDIRPFRPNSGVPSNPYIVKARLHSGQEVVMRLK